jgi:hypothetical protein
LLLESPAWAVVPENLNRLIELLNLQWLLQNRDRADLKNPIEDLAVRVTCDHDNVEVRINLLGALIKRRRATDDPELFAAYRTLAADAQSVAAAHLEKLVGLAAMLLATSRFHHPAHAAEWVDPAIEAAYNEGGSC